MKKDLLRRLNLFLVLLMALVFCCLQTTILQIDTIKYFHFNFCLILVVYLGTKRETLSGAIPVILTGMLVETFSAAPQYFIVSTYIYVYLITQILHKIVSSKTPLMYVSTTAFMSIFEKFFLLFLVGFFGKASNNLQHFFIFLIPATLTQAALTLPLFKLFHWIDLKTFVDTHSEDEYHMNKDV